MSRVRNKLKSSMKTSKAYKQVRKSIIEEIGKCEYCGISHMQAKLQVHHRQKVVNCPDLFAQRENMVVLCDKCHKKVHGIKEDTEKEQEKQEENRKDD